MCSSSDDITFHHRDPSTKLFNIGDKIRSFNPYRLEKIKAEMAKCDPVCRKCHNEIHKYETQKA
jgi:hypothetical protein